MSARHLEHQRQKKIKNQLKRLKGKEKKERKSFLFGGNGEQKQQVRSRIRMEY